MDIMLDIETLGKTPGSVVLSVGAVVFNRFSTAPRSEAPFHCNIDLFSSLMAGLTINQPTVEWWRDQGDGAKRALTTPVPISLDEAVIAFNRWYNMLNPTSNPDLAPKVWAKDPNFDCSIWEAACAAVGKLHPWHYRTPRSVRTIIDLANFDERTIASLVAHNCLEDCKVQIKQVQAAYQLLFPFPMAPAMLVGKSPFSMPAPTGIADLDEPVIKE